jgi:Flp pilus assembly protein TadG
MMKRRGRGQGLVEFALVLPVFLLLVFGMVDLGRGVWAMDAASHAASEAARFAIVHGGTGTDPSLCHVGPEAPGTTYSNPVTCPYSSGWKQMIVDVAKASAIASGGAATVTACYANPSSLVVANRTCVDDKDAPQPDGNNKRGMSVTVKVTVSVTIFTGAFLGVKNFDVSSTATMVVNN